MRARRVWLALLAALIAAGAFVATIPPAWSIDGDEPTIVLFHGEGCPHCAAERAFLADLVAEYPQVRVEEHEVWNDEDGRALLLATAARMGFEPSGVPVTIVGDRVWIGFDQTTADAITSAALAAATPTGGTDGAADATQSTTPTVDVPLLGPVALDQVSLLGATVAIGFVDGVNPCSLWVLSLLLAMVLNRGSRGRVVLVGVVFLSVTAGMYGLYMAGMYSAASYLSAMGWLRLVVALVAGTFGVLQFKDGLGVSAGPSLSISPQRRPGLYARMRSVASPDRALAATIAGTVALAVAVSLIETPCTAGLPLMWTTMLADQGVGLAEAVGLFAVYMVVFLLDEFIVFAAAVVTLRATRLQEKHGRLLKLIAGSVLICLALAMLVNPTIMTSLLGTSVVFTAAAIIAVVAYGLTAGRSAPESSHPSSGASRSSSSSTSRTTRKDTPAG